MTANQIIEAITAAVEQRGSTLTLTASGWRVEGETDGIVEGAPAAPLMMACRAYEFVVGTLPDEYREPSDG